MSGEPIVVVDDELSMREFLAILLRQEGYQVRAVPSAEEASAPPAVAEVMPPVPWAEKRSARPS